MSRNPVKTTTDKIYIKLIIMWITLINGKPTRVKLILLIRLIIHKSYWKERDKLWEDKDNAWYNIQDEDENTTVN